MQRILLLLLVFLYGNVNAQPAGNFRIRLYSTEEGLPSNGIKGLQWDEKNGFLWIATEAGIVRFNGIDFRIFSKKNMPVLDPDRISYMMRDENGVINAFNQLGKNYTVSANQLIFTEQGSRWKLRYPSGIDSGIAVKLQKAVTGYNISQSPKFLLTKTNAYLVMDNGYGLHHIILNKGESTHTLLARGNVKTIFKIGADCFLLNKNNSIHIINDSTSVAAHLNITDESGSKVNITSTSLLLWHNGMQNPVLFSGETAWLLSYSNNHITGRVIGEKVPSASLLRYAQYYEKGKTLFIGTESKGIIVITQNRVLPVKNRATGINERTAYYSQVRLSDRAVLTNEGHVLSPESNTAITSPIKGPFSFRTSLTGDSLFWYTQRTVDGKIKLLQYNLKTRNTHVYQGTNVPYSASVAIIQNKIFAATIKGIALLENDSLRYVNKYPAMLAGNNEPFDLTVYNSSSLVFATCNSLVKFDTETFRLDTLFQLKDYCIRNIRKYQDYLFIGTYGGGFYIYKNGTCRAMPLDKNNFLLYTHCFVPDEKGFCWMSTNRGLFKAKIADLLNAFEKNIPQVYYHYLGRNDGMDITEMNGGCSPCALELNASTISFPTMDGLLWVNPKSDDIVLPEGDLFIDNFIVNDTGIAYDPATVKSLPPGTKEIQIGLGFPAWCNKENIYLAYRLYDNGPWLAVEVKNESVIKLNNLPPGNYDLQVRKLNGFGENNYSYKTIRFSIAAPWHKQWWFYLLLAASATGLFILFYRVRTNQLLKNQAKLEKQVSEKTNELVQKNEALEKNNSINTRLISIISHDIVTPLKFLNVAGKNLLEKKDMMPEALKDETIKEITTTSKELQLLSTNILNWIKYQTENRRLIKESFNLHEMVNQALSVLYSLAKQKQISLDNETAKDLVIWQYFEPLKILVYNLVTNAINFSEKGSVVISCHQNARMLTITVKDEGTGMTEEQMNNIMTEQFIVSSANMDNRKGNGLGYLIIKDLLKTMNATIAITSAKGAGTAVSVTLPAGNTVQ
jgi:signal transduction histidine kinase